MAEDRGLLKRIQLHVPGFAGYRRREDIRTADNMLRIQMANMLKEARGVVEQAREGLTENKRFKDLDKVGRLVNRIQALEGKVRHGEGGYSGISADVRIEENELNRLYEFDASMLDDIAQVDREAAALKSAVDEDQKTSEATQNIRTLLDRFEDRFRRRLLVISGTEVRP